MEFHEYLNPHAKFEERGVHGLRGCERDVTSETHSQVNTVVNSEVQAFCSQRVRKNVCRRAAELSLQ